MRKLLVTAGLIASVGMGTLPLNRAQAADTPPPPPNGSFSDATAFATPVPSYNRASAVSGSAIVQYALKFLGYPYTATGNSPSTGFSCIGFVSYVYRSMGINLPGDLGGALAFAPRVAFSSLLPGDILYFQNTVWAGLSHAAIYLGGGRFVHAEWYNRGVVTSSFTNDPVDGNYWTAHYLGATRPWTGTSGVAPTASIVQRTAVTRATATVRATVSLETGSDAGSHHGHSADDEQCSGESIRSASRWANRAGAGSIAQCSFGTIDPRHDLHRHKARHKAGRPGSAERMVPGGTAQRRHWVGHRAGYRQGGGEWKR